MHYSIAAASMPVSHTKLASSLRWTPRPALNKIHKTVYYCGVVCAEVEGFAECSVFDKNEGRRMFSKNWLRIASGVGLLIASLSVVAQSMVRNDWGNQLYYGTTLIAVFGYLFLTSRTKEEERDSPWWW